MTEPLKYDDIPGSWGTYSKDWPETPYTIGKWLLCTKAEVVPYGQFVHVDDVIRVQTNELKAKLEKAYQGIFVECRHLIRYEFL